MIVSLFIEKYCIKQIKTKQRLLGEDVKCTHNHSLIIAVIEASVTSWEERNCNLWQVSEHTESSESTQSWENKREYTPWH